MNNFVGLLLVALYLTIATATTINYRDHCEYNWCSFECRKKGHVEGECYFNHITGKTVCKCDTMKCNNLRCREKCEKQGYFNGYCPNSKDPWCQCNLASKCDVDECNKQCKKAGRKDGGFCSKHLGNCVCYV